LDHAVSVRGMPPLGRRGREKGKDNLRTKESKGVLGIEERATKKNGEGEKRGEKIPKKKDYSWKK